MLSKGVSEVVLTLASIGGSENGPDEHVRKTTEARHKLACAVVLVLACLASYPGFLVITFAACHTRRLVGATDSKRWPRVEKA